MLAGKDVYCEKPITLTIAEGREICEVGRKTDRIVQIGTQQRSERQFIQAVAQIRASRLGTSLVLLKHDVRNVLRIDRHPIAPHQPIWRSRGALASSRARSLLRVLGFPT